jgi:hypothetical protein
MSPLCAARIVCRPWVLLAGVSQVVSMIGCEILRDIKPTFRRFSNVQP